MNTVYVDARQDEDTRRRELYAGQLFVFSPRPSTIALRDHAREMIQEAFGNIDPLYAQFEMPVEDYVAICAPLKPRFIHHPKTKGLVKDVIEELGCDADDTFIDVPRLRMVTSDAYLTSGVGYAHHPHRDTWYSAPMAQFNWWMPIYDYESSSSMAFHPRYFDEAIRNGSRDFNYYEWNSSGRKDAAKQIKKDTRKQPKPEQEIELDPQIRVVCEPGGIILFSAAHLHSAVPNVSGRTRYSIDFRTVNVSDLREGVAARNLDSECTGTSLRDFVRASDLSAMPDDVVARYDDASSEQADKLVFQPAG